MRNKPEHCTHEVGCYQQYRHWNSNDIRVHNRHIQFATALLRSEVARLPARPSIEQIQRVIGFAHAVSALSARQWREMVEPQPSFAAPKPASSKGKSAQNSTLSLDDLDL